LGQPQPLHHRRDGKGLHIRLPGKLPAQPVTAFRISGHGLV
jgi:hypothetical protein